MINYQIKFHKKIQQNNNNNMKFMESQFNSNKLGFAFKLSLLANQFFFFQASIVKGNNGAFASTPDFHESSSAVASDIRRIL